MVARTLVEQRLQRHCTLRIVNGTVIGPAEHVNRSHPMLCQVEMTPTAEPPDDTRTVLLIAIDQLREPGLVRTGRGGVANGKKVVRGASSNLQAWPTLLNQASYAQATRRRMYVWVGDAQLLGSPPPSRALSVHVNHGNNVTSALHGAAASGSDFAQQCTEPADATPIYHARILGMLALLMLEKPTVNAVLYVDTDVWFSDTARRGGCCLLEAYGALAPSAEIIGAGNHYMRPNGVWLNSGVMLWKRSEWVHRMLSLWWSTRCGWNDQTALYVILFAAWQAETDGRVSIAASQLQSWASSMRHTLNAVRLHIDAGHFPQSASQRWRNRTSLWERTGGRRASNPCCAISRPLELPHLLILPLKDVAVDTARVGSSGRTLPGFVGNQDPHGCVFMCHTKAGWVDNDPTVDPALRRTKGAEDPDYAYAAARGNRCKCRSADVCANGKCTSAKR